MIESLLLRTNTVPEKMGYWKSDEHLFISTTLRAAKSVARQAGESRKTDSISPTGDKIRAEFDIGSKQGCSPPPGDPEAGQRVQSIPPVNTPPHFTAPIGPVTYRAIAGCLAGNISHCLDVLLKGNPKDIRITPEWICDTHRCIAGELFEEWAGRFRTADAQVGAYFPPPSPEVADHVTSFCMALEERIGHTEDAESRTALLAWADWRFQWIHPFKDFNGKTGRVVLAALIRKLRLPPIDPTVTPGSSQVAYFAALRSADAGDMTALNALWSDRLQP
jgi:fido (protein-threonine AMPylation protein)